MLNHLLARAFSIFFGSDATLLTGTVYRFCNQIYVHKGYLHKADRDAI